MIRVTVELIPWGIEHKARTLGTAEIWNDLTGTPTRGNYAYRILTNGHIIRTGEFKDYPRKELSFWRLITEILSRV